MCTASPPSVAASAIGALVLALRTAGQAAGWGFQLQQPVFVAGLVYLMFAMGLSLSGVFTLGGGIGNLGQSLASRSGWPGNSGRRASNKACSA